MFDKSVIQILYLCPVVKWSGIQISNGCLNTGVKKPINGPKCLVIEWSAKSCDFFI